MTSQRLRNLDNKYSDDQGIDCLWSNWKDERTPYWELNREYHPLSWSFGVQVQRQVGGGWSPHMLILDVSAGPWTLGLRREWPNDRDEYLAWVAARDASDPDA